MDKNERLQLMRQKLEALQQQRKTIDSKRDNSTANIPFVSHIAQTLNINPNNDVAISEKVSISVQTDDVEVIEPDISKEQVITYEKGIQTDEYDFDYHGETRYEEDVIQDRAEQSSTRDPDRSDAETSKESLIPELEEGKLAIAPKNIAQMTQTFSLQETIEQTLHASRRQAFGTERVQLIQKITPVAQLESTKGYVAATDLLSELLVSVLHVQTKYLKSSLVQVAHVVSGEIMDSVLFEGQKIVRCKFINNPNSKITSVLLSCYTGKLILYELRSIKVENKFKIERSLVSRNVHHYPVFALLQPNLRDHSIIAGGTDGKIKQLSTLDLSVKDENNVKIVPIPRTDLLYVNEASGLPDKFQEHLSIISLYDELSIMCMLCLSSEPSYIYAGCEDGYIYKLGPTPLKSDEKGACKIDLKNNGFLPVSDSAINTSPLFHVGAITGMTECVGFEGIFFSYSLDGECIFWDTLENKRLGKIECEETIISGKLLDVTGDCLVGLLGSSSFQVIKISITKDKHDKWVWADNSTKQILQMIPDDTSLTAFSAFEFACINNVNYLLLSGDDKSIFCHAIKELANTVN